MELIVLIIVGAIYSFLAPSKNTKSKRNSNNFSSIEKYKTFENFRKK